MSLRILIADDHVTVRKHLKQLLESRPNWQVCGEASNGLEAVQKAASLKPDVIVLDVAMPVLNGYEAASRILETAGDVPILMFTQYAVEPEHRVAGVRQIISKASPQLLLCALETLQSPSTKEAAPWEG